MDRGTECQHIHGALSPFLPHDRPLPGIDLFLRPKYTESLPEAFHGRLACLLIQTEGVNM